MGCENCKLYEAYTERRAPIPSLPPISHLELGRQEALLPARQPGFTNANQAPEQDHAPLTVENLGEIMQAMVDTIGPLPWPAPMDEPVLILRPTDPAERGVSIYWTDSQGRTWGPRGRVC